MDEFSLKTVIQNCLPHPINKLIPMLNVIKYLLFLQIMKAGCLFYKENLKLQRFRNFEICTDMCTKETVAIALNKMRIRSQCLQKEHS